MMAKGLKEGRGTKSKTEGRVGVTGKREVERGRREGGRDRQEWSKTPFLL